jgi:hypothetical protein
VVSVELKVRTGQAGKGAFVPGVVILRIVDTVGRAIGLDCFLGLCAVGQRGRGLRGQLAADDALQVLVQCPVVELAVVGQEFVRQPRYDGVIGSDRGGRPHRARGVGCAATVASIRGDTHNTYI